MPVMDGYTFLKHFKADARFASIPVIVTTSNDSESDEVSALSHGATDFLTKPYRPQVIQHRVASIIRLREIQPSFTRFSMTGSPGCTARNSFISRSGIYCSEILT